MGGRCVCLLGLKPSVKMSRFRWIASMGMRMMGRSTLTCDQCRTQAAVRHMCWQMTDDAHSAPDVADAHRRKTVQDPLAGTDTPSTGQDLRHPCCAGRATHQAVLQAAAGGAHEDAAGDGQVAVEPGVPQAAAVRLHIHRQPRLRLAELGDRLQLQARAAYNTRYL
jgi:hypothetical protein